MANSQTFTLNIKALFDASQVTSGAKQIQDIFKNIKLPNNLQSEFNKAFSNLESSVNKVQQKYEQGFKTKGDVSSYEKAFKEMENAATQYEKVIQRIQNEVGTSIDLSKVIKWDSSTTEKLKELENRITELKAKMNFSGSDDSAFKSISEALKQITSTAPATTKAIDGFKQALLSGDLKTAEEQLTKLESIWKRFGEGNTNFDGVTALRNAFNELKSSGVFAELEKLYSQKGDIQTEAWQKLAATLEKAAGNAGKFGSTLNGIRGSTMGAVSAQQAWNNSLDQFKSRIQYFFGLNNIIQLVKRSIREAFNTVKELDAAMAKTAVVTKYDIGDMWNQLPQYTQLANQLGVTTKGAYETMTLFYQQGLDTNQAFALGTETMKMARIAGLDYATATDYMTAALRGFNMELNELSAQKVNDVYSRLAAITASNTQEISTAMTKVASLAHNANMEFETTSAFLAQIIETTRESAETAGTALKTVIARFSEVKKLVDTNQLKGQDEEGQVIDVNKVSAALRTAGIDMNKYFLGEVGLDDIFVELASKWDSLTAVQQRYIATQAAGSRQQSRFIAMMSNYKRTQELIGEAYNSTGASEVQFEKTQESLETAINRLKNAWDQFTMNLANHSAITTVINALTKLLEVVNKITGVFNSGWSSAITGGLTLGALFGGGRAINAAFSASKIAKASQMSWGAAFVNQFGRNPMLHNASSGQLITDDAGNQLYGSRFHLFGQGGFFSSTYKTPPATFADNRTDYEILKAAKEDMTVLPSGMQEDYIKMERDAYQKQQLQNWQRQQKKQSIQRQAGGIATAAGLALSAGGSAVQKNADILATAFDTTEEKVQKIGESMSTFGNSVSMAGSMLMLLPGPLGIVAAAITLLIGAFQAFHPETPAEALKRLTQESKQADQAAKDTKQAYEDLLSGAANHNELLDKISNLKEGTLEFRKAILDANEAALELINNYGLTTEDYTRDRNGLITFNPGVMERVQKEQLEATEKAQTRAAVAKLSVTSQEETIQRQVDHTTKLVLDGIKQALSDGKSIDDIVKDINGGSRKVSQIEEGYGEFSTFTNISGAMIAKEAAKAGYGTDYARYIKDVQDDNVHSGPSIKLQNDYQNALQEAVGSGITDAVQLGIDQLVDSFNPEEYNQLRKEKQDEVEEMGGAAARAAYREEVGEIIGDISLDEIKDQLAQTRIAEELKTRAINAGAEAQKQATKETINYRKQTAKQVLEAGKSNEALGANKDTYTDLAARKTQETISETARLIAEFTDLDPLTNLGNYTVEQVEQLGQAAQSLGSTFGKQTATAVMAEIQNSLNKGDSALLDNIISANFSGEFGALSTNLKALKEAFTDDTTATNVFNTALQEVGGEAALFESFYYNNQDVIDSLKEMADEAGNISADAILDAADNCEELSDWLEIGETNAAGLAAALTEINLDNLNAEQITNTLLKAFSAAEGIAQILGQADDFINNWKEAPSGDRFAKWATGGAKSITDAWEAGRYQDQQARQYLEALLPTDVMREYNQVMSKAGDIAWTKSGEEALEYINTNLGEEIYLMQQLQEVGNLSPLYEYYEKHSKAAADSTVEFKDGMVHFADSVRTAEDALKALTDIGINEDLASVMLGDFINTSPDAIIQWSQNAAQDGIDVFQRELDKGGTVLEGQLRAFYNKYASFFDENSENWNLWKDFDSWKAQFEGEVIKLKIDWVTSKDPIKELEDAFNGAQGLQDYLSGKGAFSQEKGFLSIGNGNYVGDLTKLNLDNLLKTFQSLGATEAQALTLADQYADKLREAGEEVSFVSSYDDWQFDEQTNSWKAVTQQVTGYSSAVEAAAEAQNRAQQSLMKMQAEMNAQAFSDMLTNLGTDGPINIEIKYSDNYETHDDTTEDVTIDYDQSSYISHDGETNNVTITYHYQNADGSEAPPGGTPPSGGTGASGGIVGSYASGSASNHLSPGPALTGEEGPEIVWNKDKGYAYVTGENHPEFQYLRPGDRVFNAQETRKILNGAASGGKVPSLATGYLPGIGGSSSGGGGRGGGGGGGGGDGSEEKPTEWKNELDWLYNLMEDIAELERDQKAIEEQYEDYLQDQSKTGQDLYKLLVKQLGNLYTQLEHQQFTLQKREQEMREFMDVTNDKDQYLWYNWQDRTIEIDWDAIDKIRDEEQYKHVKELIDEAEEIQDKIDDADDAIMDITNQIQELENIWRDTFVDFEKRVYDTIVKSYQQVIDKYSDLNDTLNDSNQQILDSLQREIDLQRQIRDNTKTEEEIADDEARLAYLRRDTSGGNEVDALGLEKELEEKRENYTDTLIDQAISKLSESNDLAAQQREKQIEIMQAQLDYQSENGEFNQYVRELLEGAIGDDGELLNDSNLVTLLKEQENWDAMSDVSKQVWEEELNNTFKEVVAFLLKQNSEENGTFYTAVTEAIKGINATIGSYSQALVKLGSGMAGRGGPSDAGGGGGSSGSGGSPGGGKPAQSNAFAKTSGGFEYGNFSTDINKKPIKFATGGLSTTTGLAWLDGTPQEPEYVLNARQTDAFLRLADVLPNMMNTSGSTTTNTFGTSTFNLSINVDRIASDYDVDHMCDLIKERLYDSGAYRNVNSLSFIR